MPSAWVEERGRTEGRREALGTPALLLRVAAAVVVGGVGLSVAWHLVDQHLPGMFARDLGTADRVVVDKSERRMRLLAGGDVLAEYRVALGANPVGHKEVEGDSRTPEGTYSISSRKVESDFHRALHISYPDRRDETFAHALGRSAGGAIMIHGQPNDLTWVDRLLRERDWTDGCIAVSNRAMEEIWAAVADGTPIDIRP